MQMGIRTEDIGVSALSSSMFFLFFILLLSQYYCDEIYDITPSQPLAQGQTLVSPGHIFELGFFSPNNSANKYVGIWHKNISPRKFLWVANRKKPLAVSDTLANLIISSNGTLELVDGWQSSVWSANISVQSNGSAAILSDNGNLVVKDSIGTELWNSFDYPSDTLLPNMMLGFGSKSGKRNFLTAWKSENDSSNGVFLVGLSPQAPSQVFIWANGSTPYWRSGPWDKSKFTGIPEMSARYLSGFNLDDDVKQGRKYFSYNFFGNTVAYLDISSEGVLKMMLSETGENWQLNWETPKNPCDIYGACGPFGVCKTSESPICKCLKGYVPKLGDKYWSGCVRHPKYSCERDYGFWKMERSKLPDFHEYIPASNSANCKILCLNNCSCRAYAYVNNIGCLVWSQDLIDIQEFSSEGVDLFIRLVNAELGEGKPIKLIVSLTAISFISILGAIVFGLHRFRANQRGKEHFDGIGTSDSPRDILQGVEQNDPSELPMFDFDSILIATNFFSAANKLGQGGFGPVYKGKLQDGNEIAVKRLSSSSGQGIEEFKNEIVLISKLRHRNLVRLMGWCIHREEKLLIYEFLQNKSLDTYLFDPIRRAELSWDRRFNIIHGIARGLLYLHRDSSLRVIHRDLKASNILLDEKMNPKISDFGLARMFEGTLDLTNTHKLVGTLGYLSPEYVMGGMFSVKSDVFSFGVLLLEIVSGKKNTTFYNHEEQISLVAYAWQLWSECRGIDLVDEALAGSFSKSEVLRCIHVGLLCVQDRTIDRPTTPDIVSLLSSETDCPQPKQPIFVVHSQSDNVVCSLNEANLTVVEGR